MVWRHAKRQWPSLLIALACLLGCPSLRARPRKHQRALLVEVSTYDACHYDCAPFNDPNLYFCFQLGDRILVGRHDAGWFWTYDPFRMEAFEGKPVSIRYDKHHIWVIRTDGKELRLSRKPAETDVFQNAACTAQVHRVWLSQMKELRRPAAVPAGAVLVPQGPRSIWGRTGPHFWVRCRYRSATHWDLCTSWDQKGEKYESLEGVNAANHRPELDSELAVDPLTTRYEYEIHLKNGVVLVDWAKGRIDDQPMPGSKPPLPPLPHPH